VLLLQQQPRQTNAQVRNNAKLKRPTKVQEIIQERIDNFIENVLKVNKLLPVCLSAADFFLPSVSST